MEREREREKERGKGNNSRKMENRIGTRSICSSANPKTARPAS